MPLPRRNPDLRRQLGGCCLVAGFVLVSVGVWLGVESLSADPTDFVHVFAATTTTMAGAVGVPLIVAGFVLARRRAG